MGKMGRVKERKEKKPFQKKWIFLTGVIIGVALFISAYQVSVYFSSDESCMMCHVHPHAEKTWKQGFHVNSKSGVMTHCVDCHLPPKNQTWNHYSAKVKLGVKDLWGYLLKDSANINWGCRNRQPLVFRCFP